MKKLTYSEMHTLMSDAVQRGEEMTAVIVYSSDNWEEDYSLESRSYVVHNSCKAFNPHCCGYSLFGSALDGSDNCVRLDWQCWKVEYCYIKNEE